MLNVHPNTIYNSIKSGRIHACRIGGGKKGSYRIYENDIERLIESDSREIIEKIIQNRVEEELKKRGG